uniref:Uncharacterized protein n=1 Tax=Oryza nivara TaxID=4536 RepID=A0A0E0GWR4_ORYNI
MVAVAVAGERGGGGRARRRLLLAPRLSPTPAAGRAAKYGGSPSGSRAGASGGWDRDDGRDPESSSWRRAPCR